MKYSAKQAAEQVGVSIYTLNSWYHWYRNDKYAKPEGLVLPQYELINDRQGRMFSDEDIEVLRKFKDNLFYGAMAEYNARHVWGARGKQIIKNKKRRQKNEEAGKANKKRKAKRKRS